MKCKPVHFIICLKTFRDSQLCSGPSSSSSTQLTRPFAILTLCTSAAFPYSSSPTPAQHDTPSPYAPATLNYFQSPNVPCSWGPQAFACAVLAGRAIPAIAELTPTHPSVFHCPPSQG